MTCKSIVTTLHSFLNTVAKNSVRPSEGAAERSAMRESQLNLLWITVLGFVFHRHPDDINHVPAEADEGLLF